MKWPWNKNTAALLSRIRNLEDRLETLEGRHRVPIPCPTSYYTTTHVAVNTAVGLILEHLGLELAWQPPAAAIVTVRPKAPPDTP